MKIEKNIDLESLYNIWISYKNLSVQLGMHKESFNYYNQITKSRIKNAQKIKQFYQSVDEDKELKSFEDHASKAFILKNQNNSHKTFGEFKFDQSVFNNDYKKYKFANKELNDQNKNAIKVQNDFQILKDSIDN